MHLNCEGLQSQQIDLREANDVEIRPQATYIRVARYVDSKTKSSLDQFAKRALSVGAFALTNPPFDSDQVTDVVSMFGKTVAEVGLNDDLNLVLHTFGISNPSAPDFALVFVGAEANAVLVDFSSVWWRLTSLDLSALRAKDYWAEPETSERFAIVAGDPGQPYIGYDDFAIKAATPDASHALSTLKLAFIVPGVKLPVKLVPPVSLILDNRRMLTSFHPTSDCCGDARIVLTKQGT